MFCSNCGKEVNENAVICTQCGCYVNGNTSIGKSSSVKKSNKAVDLIMIISYAVYCIFNLIVSGTTVGMDATPYIIKFVFSILFAGSIAVAFALSFKVEKVYSKTTASLLFVYALYTMFQNMFTMISVLQYVR